MAKAMTKSQIQTQLADRAGLKKREAAEFMENLATLAYKEARNGFTIPGLGKLVVVDRKARMGRNPRTGEEIRIPAKRVLKFRIAKQAKDAILGSRQRRNGA
jgi:DNA-binding protein HU-beta